jgi:DNA-binding transcriptional LysR family regulator
VPKVLCRSTKALELKELAALPWAVLEGRGHFRQFLEGKARECGCKLNAVLECSSYTQVAMAVQTGRYAGFLPEFAKNAAFTGNSSVIQRPLEKGLRYDRSLVLAWREASVRNRPFLEKVIEALRVRIGKCL